MAILAPNRVNPAESIPDTTSDASAWIQWHKELKNRYGKKTANHLWMLAWKNSGTTGVLGVSTADLRAYMEKQGVILDKNALASAQDTALGVFSKVGDIFQIGEYAAIGILIVIIGGSALLIYNLAKKPEVLGKIAKAAK
jgi:hypothetical protein